MRLPPDRRPSMPNPLGQTYAMDVWLSEPVRFRGVNSSGEITRWYVKNAWINKSQTGTVYTCNERYPLLSDRCFSRHLRWRLFRTDQGGI